MNGFFILSPSPTFFLEKSLAWPPFPSDFQWPFFGGYYIFLDPYKILNTYSAFIQILVALRFKNVEVWRLLLFLGGPHLCLLEGKTDYYENIHL